MSRRIGVVGGGIIGLAIALRLRRLHDQLDVTVLEKESGVARHQTHTQHNSGVVHAGLYYPPGSLKATLCRRGAAMLRDFCSEHGIAYLECGKLVVARTTEELPALGAIHERARGNAVPGLQLVEGAALRDIEPHVRGIRALHSPQTAIVDFAAVARALASDLEAIGGQIRCRFPVSAMRTRGDQVVVSGEGGTLAFDRLVVCAGLQTDRVARLAGHDEEPKVIPFRGEYYTLVPERSWLVRGLVYPVPDARYPFLGVHFTRRVDGTVDVGPNAVLALAREGYRRRDVKLEDVRDILGWPGFRSLARTYWRTGAGEVLGSVSKRWFLRAARTYVPELGTRDVVAGPTGVRAQAVDRAGHLVDDFSLSELGPVLAVRNAPSPAATSSLAIAEHICDRVIAGIGT